MSIINGGPMEHRAAGLNAFLRITAKWGLSDRDAASLLGFDHKPVPAEIDLDRLERISHTLAVFRALNSLLPGDAADAWINKPNTANPFGGRTALDLMRTGTGGFRTLRNYLTGELGW